MADLQLALSPPNTLPPTVSQVPSIMRFNFTLRPFCLVIAFLALQSIPTHTRSLYAETKLSPIFGDSMVLQRDEPIHIWGWTVANTPVTVSIADKSATATADQEGRFDVSLEALPAGGPHELKIEADQTIMFKDVLMGEVWLCSGQSNMAWPVVAANDGKLESMTAKFPNLRLISVPNLAAQVPVNDFHGHWESCTPESVNGFSAVGYYFGRQLHQTLDVPIGLIDNAWGGSSAEAWVPVETLQSAGGYEDMLERWKKLEETYDYGAEIKKWKESVRKWEDGGRQGATPRRPGDQLNGNHRPGNLYNGCLHPVIGYTIRGTIWYQGESNAGRAYQYRDLFPLMIQTWRDHWKQNDFSFYWVQLADFKPEKEQPSESAWAELREAQTMTLDRLPETGQAVIIDLGEASDIHPKNKQDVGKRLARLALVNDYGIQLVAESPRFESMKIEGNKAIVTLKNPGGGLDTFDVKELLGFTIAGADKKFVDAQARIVSPNKIEVTAESVQEPVSVRYAWADNPVANVQNKEGLPVTPFRSDQWDGITKP